MGIKKEWKIKGNKYQFEWNSVSNSFGIYLIVNGGRQKIEGLPEKVLSWTPPYIKDKDTYITFWITASEFRVYCIENELKWREIIGDELHLKFPREDC